MGEMVGSDEMVMVRGDRDDGENLQERVFKVGRWERSWSCGKGPLCVGIGKRQVNLLL